MRGTPAGALRIEVRGEVLREGELVTGWCFSPDRPRERLRVGLYVDDVLHGSTVAARYRGDLVQDGVCDGYHGFSLPLPGHLSSGLIELREQQTGHAFGRLLSAERSDVRAWTAQIAALEDKAAEIARVPPFDAASPRIGAAFATIGGLIAPVRDAESARIAALRLPRVDQPRLSLVLCASWGLHGLVAAALLRLAPALGALGAEVLICDDGRHALSAAFATVDHARHLRLDEVAGTDLLGVALPRARAPHIAFLDPATAGPAGLAELLPVLGQGDTMVAGGAVGELLAETEETLRTGAEAAFFDGVLLAAAPAALGRFQALDENPRGIVYRLADRAMAAHRSGITLRVARPRGVGSILLGYETEEAERAFTRRWAQTRRGRLMRGG